DRLIVMVLRFVDDADALHDTMNTGIGDRFSWSDPGGGRYFSGSETNRSIPKRWERNLATSCPLTLFPAPSNGGGKIPHAPLPGREVAVPAADSALAGQPNVVKPIAGGLV